MAEESEQVSAVFDASALLAVMLGEPGSEIVLAEMRRGLVSTVNVVEVIQRMADHGIDSKETLKQLSRLEIEIVPFDLDQAAVVASLRPATRHKGVSLADRACLALGIDRGLPVFTTDRIWTELALPLDIRLIR